MKVRQLISALSESDLESEVQVSMEYKNNEIVFIDIDFISASDKLDFPTLINVSCK